MTAIVAPLPRGRSHPASRASVKGKFLFLGDEKLQLKGVTYGPFSSDDEDGAELDLELVERDFARDGSQRAERRPPVHRASALAARRRGPARAPRHGRHPLGAARRVPRRSHAACDRSSAASREAVRSCAGHPAVLCLRDRQRDPGARSCAGTAGAGSSASCTGSTGPRRRRTRRSRHVRQLPLDRVPPACRSSTSSASTSTSSRATGWTRTSRGSRTSPTSARCSWPRSGSTAAGTARRRRPRPSTGRFDLASRRAARARSSSRGRTSGTAAATTSTTGTSGSPTRDRTPEAGARRRRVGLRRGSPFPRAMRWPRVSVVVCTYNGAATLGETASTGSDTWTTPTTR